MIVLVILVVVSLLGIGLVICLIIHHNATFDNMIRRLTALKAAVRIRYLLVLRDILKLEIVVLFFLYTLAIVITVKYIFCSVQNVCIG